MNELKLIVREEVFDGIEHMLVQLASSIPGYQNYHSEQNASFDMYLITFSFHDSVNLSEHRLKFEQYLKSLVVIME